MGSCRRVSPPLRRAYGSCAGVLRVGLRLREMQPRTGLSEARVVGERALDQIIELRITERCHHRSLAPVTAAPCSPNASAPSGALCADSRGGVAQPFERGTRQHGAQAQQQGAADQSAH